MLRSLVGSEMCIRDSYKGPLTDTSAFAFESFYGELRRSFVTGTPSTLKQMLQTVYLRRNLHHNCTETIYFSPKETDLQSNNIIYTFNNGEYDCYKITEINDQDFVCNPIGIFPVKFPETPNLNWNSVGVFRQGGINESPTNIRKRNVAGKMISINKLFITCPNNVLREK